MASKQNPPASSSPEPQISKIPPAPTYKFSDYKTDVHPDWCPGCGDFGIVSCIQRAMAQLGLDPWRVVTYSGVGCSSKTPHFVKTYGVHTLHGRVLPFAMGAKLANPALEVVAAGGDGDGLGIGLGHFVHAGRRNIDMTYILYNNEVYGLTKGQASPTLAEGTKPKSLPLPNMNQSVNPLALAITAGYTFVAQSYAFDGAHLTQVIQAAIQHKGMALVDVLQPCPTYNNLHNKEFFSGVVEQNGQKVPRTYKLEETGYNGKVNNPKDEEEINQKKLAALARAMKKEERVALGIFYQVSLPTYTERLELAIPALKGKAPAALAIEEAATHKPSTDLVSAYKDFLI